MRRRNIFISTILAGFAIVLFAFLFVVLISSSDKPDNVDNLALANNPLINTDATKVGLSRVTTDSVLYIHPDTTGTGVVYYVPESGDIMSLSFSGQNPSSSLVASIRPRAKNISWDTRNDQLFAQYIDGTMYYNLLNGDNNGVHDRIHNPTFSRVPDLISYVYFNEETREGNISISDPQISSFKNIISTRSTKWDMQWITDDKIALINSPEKGGDLVSLVTLDVGTKSLATIVKDRSSLDTSWSPDGSVVIYSYLNKRADKYELHAFNTRLGTKINLGLSSVASKCAWKRDNKTAFCAVPEETITKNSFIRSSDDAFYVIDITSGKKTELIGPTSVDVGQIVFLPTRELLLVMNEKNGSLYKLPTN